MALECGSLLLLLSGRRLELVALGETNFRACYEGEVRREKRPVYLNLAKGGATQNLVVRSACPLAFAEASDWLVRAGRGRQRRCLPARHWQLLT